MKVLIIGNKGMLGQALFQVFLKAKQNYEVIGWDLPEIDIVEKSQLEEKITGLKPQIIINAAAYNAVDRCEEEEAEFEKAKKLNALAPGYLAVIAKEMKAVFVHFSTDYVFGGVPPKEHVFGYEKARGFKEDDQPSPLQKYGWTKLWGEEKVQSVGGQYFIIRTQRLFGRAGSSILAKKSFFEKMLLESRVKKEIKVVDDEVSDFTYVPDLAGQTKDLIESWAPNSSPGIYHIFNEGQPVSWYGAAKKFFKEAGISDVKLVPISGKDLYRPAKRPENSVLINSKLSMLRPWPLALKDFLKDLKI